MRRSEPPRLRRLALAIALSLVGMQVSTLPADDEVTDSAEASAAGSTAQSDSAAESKSGESGVVFHRVRVVGTPDRSKKIPGSVSYLDKDLLARHDHDDIHRTLGFVPGVNFQEEDGFGLRPNIGMRGTGVERSSKITLLEDGVLAAPAPYSAPSAYYFPTVERMEGVEVRKGSSSIQQGPFTNGGVLNLLSTSIPSSFGGRAQVSFGDDATGRGRVYVGDSTERFGWMVEGFHATTDGFKNLDTGADTGFDLQDFMGKLRFMSRPDAEWFQVLELKLGHTTQRGMETYVGLSQQDFDDDPFRRYAGSQLDRIDLDHDQYSARHLLRRSKLWDLTTTVYRSDTFRNWRKLQNVSGVGIGDVLDDPTTYAAELDILRADLTADSADDSLFMRSNRRDYYSQGVHAVLGLHPGDEGVHDIEVGVRYHEDEEDRFQEEDGFRMTTDGEMQLTSSGAPGSQSNRVNEASAWALFVQDTITFGRWIVTPGVRFESIDFTRTDYDDPARQIAGRPKENEVDEWIPGVGASYELAGSGRIFAGVHRGFAPPGPGSNQLTQAEDSVNYELGYRQSGPISTQLVAFFNDYDNLLGACTESSGCTGGDIGDLFNGGEVEVLGFEAAVGYDLSRAFATSWSMPLDLAYTYTDATFQNSFSSDFDPWGDVVAGDELPYIPQHQASLGLGGVTAKYSIFAQVSWIDEMRTEAGQGAIPRDESTDSRFLLDLSASYRLQSGLKLVLHVRNVFDEVYAVARRPAGVRPGRDRNAMIGVVWDF